MGFNKNASFGFQPKSQVPQNTWKGKENQGKVPSGQNPKVGKLAKVCDKQNDKEKEQR